MQNIVRLHPQDVTVEMARTGVSRRHLAHVAGLHYNTLKGIGRPGWNPRWETLEALCRALAAMPDAKTKNDVSRRMDAPSSH